MGSSVPPACCTPRPLAPRLPSAGNTKAASSHPVGSTVLFQAGWPSSSLTWEWRRRKKKKQLRSFERVNKKECEQDLFEVKGLLKAQSDKDKFI